MGKIETSQIMDIYIEGFQEISDEIIECWKR